MLKICFVDDFAKEVYQGGALLKYQTHGSSGIDLRSLGVIMPNGESFQLVDQDSKFFDSSSCKTEFELLPGASAIVRAGIRASIPTGTEIQIRSRSGLTWRHGVVVLNGVGTIDSDYRGELGCIMFNAFKKSYIIKPGERIAQMVICPVIIPEIQYVDQLEETERGAKGFGSTGRD